MLGRSLRALCIDCGSCLFGVSVTTRSSACEYMVVGGTSADQKHITRLCKDIHLPGLDPRSPL